MSDLTSEVRSVKSHAQLPEMVARTFRYTYRTGPFALPPSMIKGKSEQCQSKMLSILEGDMEVHRWGDEEHFDAVVHTEEGRKFLTGRLPTVCQCVDIQSGSLSRWQVVLQEADEAIRRAYDSLIPREAIKVISTIWEQLDRTSELAAARSRLLVGKLGKPKMAPLPKWFEDQKAKFQKVDEDDVAANPFAVASAELLVRATLSAIPEDINLQAEIEAGPRGRVIIDWHVPKGRLQWMVEAMDIPWPSVKVYQVSHRPEQTPVKALKTRIFYNAFDVIESFVQLLNGN